MVIAVEQVTDESVVVVAKSDFSGRITHREIEIQLEKFERGMDAWGMKMIEYFYIRKTRLPELDGMRATLRRKYGNDNSGSLVIEEDGYRDIWSFEATDKLATSGTGFEYLKISANIPAVSPNYILIEALREWQVEDTSYSYYSELPDKLFDTRRVLAYAAAINREYGFVSKAFAEKTNETADFSRPRLLTTAELVTSEFYDYVVGVGSIYPTEGDDQYVNDAVHWIQAVNFPDEYMFKVQQLAGKLCITENEIATLVSLIPAYENQLLKSALANVPNIESSMHIGKEGETLEEYGATVIHIKTMVEPFYNSKKRFIAFVTKDGNYLSTLTTGAIEVSKGEVVNIKFQVKDHVDYVDTFETRIKRVRLIDSKGVSIKAKKFIEEGTITYKDDGTVPF
jgi:hypothetical protein